MSAAEVWSYVQFALSVGALVWCLYLHGRLERAEVRLAQSRIDTFNLVDTLAEHFDPSLQPYLTESLDVRLVREFPHLYDVDEREADERAAERAS